MAAHETVGRPQADDAAQSGRTADRSAGVRAQRARHESRGDRRPRTAAGAAGEMIEIPRIARGRPRQVESGTAVRELVRGKLADEYGSGLVKPRDRSGIDGGNVVDADLRMPGSEDAGRVVEVLQAERDAVHWAAVAAARDFRLGGARLAERQLGRHGDEGVDARIERFDATEQRLGQLDRRELARRNEPRRLGDGEEMQFVRHCANTQVKTTAGLNGSFSYAHSECINGRTLAAPAMPSSARRSDSARCAPNWGVTRSPNFRPSSCRVIGRNHTSSSSLFPPVVVTVTIA